MKKYENEFGLFDELDFISEKLSFLSEAAAAMAGQKSDVGCSENAILGLYRVYWGVIEDLKAVSQTLHDDFIITKKLPSKPEGKTNEGTLDHFCAMVEKGISKPCEKHKAGN